VVDASQGCAIGGADLPLRALAPGVTAERSLALCAVKKRKLNKKGAGQAGTVRLAIHLAAPGEPAFVDAPWSAPLHSATVEFVGAAGLAVADPAAAELCVEARLAPACNAQRTATRPARDAAAPEWGERHEFFFDALDDAALSVAVVDRDARLAAAVVPLRQFAVGAGPQEAAVALAPGGQLTLRVEVRCDSAPAAPARAAPLDGDDEFRWGSYSSSYATNFTGYSACSERLSDIRPEEAAYHTHPAMPPVENPHPPKKPALFALTGRVVAARELPLGGGGEREYCVAAAVASKVGKERRNVRSEAVAGTADPAFNFEFDLGDVRKGFVVEFTVFQLDNGEAAPVAFAQKKVKEIELDSDAQIELALEAPPVLKFEKVPWTFTAWGTLVVVLTQSLKPTEVK
jgi:hypothetical protein